MGDDKSKSSFLSISGVLIILAALGVTIFTQPFKGSRPFVPELRESYQRVNARLWQDPFQAVLEAVKGGKEPKNNGEFNIDCEDENAVKGDKYPEKNGQFGICKKDLNQEKLTTRLESWKSHTGGSKRIIVLGVMVPGAPYAEDMEVRMRYRYAALSGLSRLGFIPEDSEHIGFIKLENSKDITLSNIMPFEWLMHTEKERIWVLVLWINDNLFQKSPLRYLSKVAECLQLTNKGNQSDVRFRIIGPATSDTLKQMVREVFDRDISKKLKFPQCTQIYSAMATMNNRLLHKANLDEDLKEEEAQEKIIDAFRDRGITFKRTIQTDNKLAEELVKELDLRGIQFNKEKEKPHILLVSEWDTYYGRSFHDAFRAALKNKIASDKIDQQVHRISYMRGIDGSLPGEKEEKKDEKAEAKTDPLKDTRNIEQPIGKSQYDYLRRLAEETYRLDQDLRANREGEIKAIGILGTDFYDKYLVLQALRQRFPDVIFFTTDMDARYLHSDNIKWTRNLVVASNFGLSLRNEQAAKIQGEIPPFRDNYQTSIFLAVLQAFPPRAFLWNKKEFELINQPSQPLIFEIGRYEAVLLTDPGDTLHPGKFRMQGVFEFHSHIAGIILAALIFLFFTSSRVNKYVKELFAPEKKYRRITVIIVLTFIVFAVAIYLISNQPDEEPFSFFQGISIWPTEIFRFITILLSTLFIYLSWTGRKKNTERIKDEFNFNVLQNSVSLRGIWDSFKKISELDWQAVKNMWDCLKRISEFDWKAVKDKRKVSLESLWAEYVIRDSDRYHVWRVIIIAILYFSFCFLIISFDFPVSPVRGRITPYIDKFLLMVSVISFIALLSYVFEVTRCCSKFIVAVSNEFSKEYHEHRNVGIQVEISNQLKVVRLIAQRTATVGKLIFYPFIVWLGMFVSRFEYFDNWKTPYGLAVVISLGALYAWACALFLRQSGEFARTSALERLKKLKGAILTADTPKQDLIKYVDFVIDEVKSIRSGAFAPFTQHPVVQSLLVPFGGVGGIYFIDFLRKINM